MPSLPSTAITPTPSPPTPPPTPAKSLPPSPPLPHSPKTPPNPLTQHPPPHTSTYSPPKIPTQRPSSSTYQILSFSKIFLIRPNRLFTCCAFLTSEKGKEKRNQSGESGYAAFHSHSDSHTHTHKTYTPTHPYRRPNFPTQPNPFLINSYWQIPLPPYTPDTQYPTHLLSAIPHNGCGCIYHFQKNKPS